ncbi:MAG: RNA 2',3'-cyclic phosphodiesterase [Candidatus Moraniibacteriota bacterium]
MLITRRLFIGIPLSSRLHKRLESEVSRFERFPIIPTRKGNFHVTLIFLGFVNEEEIPRIMSALEEAVADTEPFELDFSMIQPEPNDEHPSMIWLTGDTSPALVLLRNAVASALDYLTPASKTFRPHILLAKVRRGKFEALDTKPEFTKPLHIIESVDTITLFESTTDAGKRAYLPLAEFPLGGNA